MNTIYLIRLHERYYQGFRDLEKYLWFCFVYQDYHNISLVRLARASSVPRPFRKPYCESGNNLFSSRYLVNESIFNCFFKNL